MLDPEVFENRSTQGVLLQERSVAERGKFHYYLAHTYAQAGRSTWRCSISGRLWKRASRNARRFRRIPRLPP